MIRKLRSTRPARAPARSVSIWRGAATRCLGTERGPGRQVKHADRCDIPIALVYGADEKARGVVALKDMQAGKQKSKDVADREAWRQTRPGQREVPRAELVSAVRELLRQIEGE